MLSSPPVDAGVGGGPSPCHPLNTKPLNPIFGLGFGALGFRVTKPLKHLNPSMFLGLKHVLHSFSHVLRFQAQAVNPLSHVQTVLSPLFSKKEAGSTRTACRVDSSSSRRVTSVFLSLSHCSCLAVSKRPSWSRWGSWYRSLQLT